jgi:sugar phosphate isomerase/epimerase
MIELAFFADDISQDLDHALDVVQELGAALRTGAVDLLGQLRALKDDGYAGVVSMENHFWPEGDMEAGVRRSFAGAQDLLMEV